MPILVQDDSGNRLLLKGTGAIDIAEMRLAVDQFRAGERRLQPILLDLSEATLSFSADDVAALAEERARENKRSPLGPLAVAATADEVYGLGRMFKSYSDANSRPYVGVFRDKLTAEDWLRSLNTR